MPVYVDPDAQSQRESDEGYAENYLFWFTGMNRVTQAVESAGLWDGLDDINVLVRDMFTGTDHVRTFTGSGGMIGIENPSDETGLDVLPMEVSLSPMDSSVAVAVLQYDLQGGTAQIWRQTRKPESGIFVGLPERVFKGYISDAPVPRNPPGQDTVMAIELESAVRTLSVKKQVVKSHQQLRQREVTDTFRRYKAAMETIETVWGIKDLRQ